MQYIIIILISIIILVVLAIILSLDTKKIKKLAQNDRLNKLTNGFPENIEICKSILNKLQNTDVKIEQETETKTSLYLVLNNKIVIANIRDNFTRIQTIAHECLHSVQSKKMLYFNFIYTNIYLLYFIIGLILTLFGCINNKLLYIAILILLGTLQYIVRSFLETDAMIKARYVAKEYIEDKNLCSKEECNEIIQEYDKLNNIGIKLVNYDIFLKNIIKLIIYCVVCIVY